MAQTVTPASTPVSGYGSTIEFEAKLIVECVRARNWRKKITQPLSNADFVDDGQNMKTDSGWPIVQIMTLNGRNPYGGGMGDRITLDEEMRVGGVPIPGDVDATGTGQPLTYSRDQITLLAQTFPIDAGGIMDRQRSPHNLRRRAMLQMPPWIGDYEDQVITTMLAGARGFNQVFPQSVPLQSAPNFATALSNNPCTPPTPNRYFLSNGGATPLALDTTCTMNLNFFDKLRVLVSQSEVPLHGVSMQSGINDEKTYDLHDRAMPLWLAFLTEEQYNSLVTDVSTQNWRYFVSQANTRLSFMNHPLFYDGEVALWRNILITTYPRPITWDAGQLVPYYSSQAAANAGAISYGAAPFRMQRGFLVGSEALAMVNGDATPIASGKNATMTSSNTEQGNPFSYVEETFNAGKQLKGFGTIMPGFKKLVYTHRGNVWDNGVVAFDTYQAPIGNINP
jgi:hypothetical protein